MLRCKGLEQGTVPVIRYGGVSHADHAVRREYIGLKPGGVGRGRTEYLFSGLEESCQSQENTLGVIRADLVTSESNGVRVLVTLDGGTVAELNIECLPDSLSRGARFRIVQLMPIAIRQTALGGEERIAAGCVKLHCTPLD